MRQLEIAGRVITDADCFVIAEIGANHCGDADLCERMIIKAAECGADAVKLQKRDIDMFTKTALNKEYDTPDSYGRTYREHRERLDWFGEREFLRFKATAEKHGLVFFATPFEEKSAEFLLRLEMPLWKIASCDVRNLPLVRKVAGYGKPVIISTGGATKEDVGALVREIEPINSNYALLHCTSVYANVTDKMLNLNVIGTMRDAFPDKVIGLSSHHPGVLPLMIARAKGASIFEVHFTFDRSQKGTDHKFSMEPNGLRRICEDLPRVSVMLGDGEKQPIEAERGGFVYKMGKSVYLTHPMHAGERVTYSDVCIKSPGGGMNPGDVNRLIGAILINDTSTGVALDEGSFF